MNKVSGVYKITNNITGESYIGSSKNIKRRWINHKSPSNWSRHPNSKLYQDMIQYGLNNFEFKIIEETDNLKEREQYWIDQAIPSYNNNRANGWDTERYKESRKKYQQSDKGKESLKESRKKYQQSDKGKEYHRRYLQSEIGKENNRKYARKSMKRYNNQICSYNGETLTLNALSQRFYIAGIEHPVLEAKKYLIAN